MNPVVKSALVDARRALEEMYGDRLSRVVLYGSHARGDAHEDSDVDVLVILHGEVDAAKELRRLAELKILLMRQYDEDVSFQPYSETDFADPSIPFLSTVRLEGVAL